MLPIPNDTGTYALFFSIDRTTSLSVGRLGRFEFPRGNYVYLGSAFGMGGLRARLRHHLQSNALSRWHLDWLRPIMNIQGYGWSLSKDRLECSWSKTMAAIPDAQIPVPGFGASDCRNGCRSHLVFFPEHNLPMKICGDILIHLESCKSVV